MVEWPVIKKLFDDIWCFESVLFGLLKKRERVLCMREHMKDFLRERGERREKSSVVFDMPSLKEAPKLVGFTARYSFVSLCIASYPTTIWINWILKWRALTTRWDSDRAEGEIEASDLKRGSIGKRDLKRRKPSSWHLSLPDMRIGPEPRVHFSIRPLFLLFFFHPHII